MRRLLPAVFVFLPLLSLMAQLPKLDLVPVGKGFTHPVDIKNCGDDRIFIVDEDGHIRIMDKQGNVLPTDFLDIHLKVDTTTDEQGLLGLAFSPHYKQDSFFYVNYVAGVSGVPGTTTISRFKVSANDSNQADPASEKVLLSFVQPFTNHKGGFLAFGPDGYLYDGQGDGGSSGDPDTNGQNKDVFLAKLLRLDVSNPDTTYMIPPTNPLVGQPNTRPEIWAYGLRNPWRCSFDYLTGDLWIADVGQNLWEEVDFQPAASTGGQNYGWNCYEADHTYSDGSNCPAQSAVTFPIYEYDHTGSPVAKCAILGGYVYRGARFSNLFGKYIYTDYCSGGFVDIRQTSPGVFAEDTLQNLLADTYSCFGQDNHNELYVAGVANGVIYHLTDTSNCAPVAFISFKDTISNCSSVTLTALYGDSLTYQWYNEDGIINGANSNQVMTTSNGWYKVSVSVTNSPGCSAMSDSVYANVEQDALIACNDCSYKLCSTQAPVMLTNFYTPAGGYYTGKGVSIDSIFDPSVPGAGYDTLLYTYTNILGCITTAPLILQIGDTTPLTIIRKDTFIFAGSPSFSLDSFVTPASGIFSGIGVDANSFNPGAAHLGMDTILYQLTNNFGCVSHDTILISIDIPPGINSPSIESDIKISPNPNDGHFTLTFGQAFKQTNISLYNVHGMLISNESLKDTPTGNKEFDISSLAKGVYMLKISTEQGTAVKRLVVQ